MEDKLNDLMNDGDYYSAHQLILSLTKRKLKLGKTEEAVKFVKNGVKRLCAADQFASAADAAMSIFEYATPSNFSDMKEMFSDLLNSADSQHWRKFLNECGKEGFLESADSKSEVLILIFASSPSNNGDKLTAISNIILQLSDESRREFLTKFATCLTGSTDEEVFNLHLYYIAELSLHLVKELQFCDNVHFLNKLSSIINGAPCEDDDSVAPVEKSEYRLVNFCILVNGLCQRKSPPKSLFIDILNEYLPESLCKLKPDMAKLRVFAENSLGPVFWPAPRSRYGPGVGGPPPDLMNMLQGLLGGPQMRR